MPDLLPLFPLETVLFPRSLLPLHIFEERYKRLINECLEQKGKEFGISLVQSNTLARIGCSAVVANLLKVYDDGRMDIVVLGKRRFTLLKASPGVGDSYSMATVRFFETGDEDIDSGLMLKTVDLHNKLVEMVYPGKGFALVSDPVRPVSFQIAQKAGMDLHQRQELLELVYENDRLQFLHDYFVRTIPMLERVGEIERIVKSDGYLIHNDEERQ